MRAMARNAGDGEECGGHFRYRHGIRSDGLARRKKPGLFALLGPEHLVRGHGRGEQGARLLAPSFEGRFDEHAAHG
jgi:hypothetical protein